MNYLNHFVRRNDALRINPGTADIAITTRGSDWYWTVTAVMALFTFIFTGLALTKPRQNRIFHYITAAVTMTAAVAYFSMASNLGWTPIDVEFRRSDSRVRGVTREIFYVRYIDWFITTPLLLMDLLLTAGMPWPTLLWVIFVDWVMIVTGLVGALVQSTYKWGYFAFGCAALVYIVYQLAWEARIHANHLGNDVGRTFLLCGSLTTILWICYPIAWGVCEGGNVIAPDSEAVFYGVLDLLAKPVFGALLIWGHRNIDPARLGLRIRDYDEDPAVTGGVVGHEKRHATNGHSNGATNTTTTNGTDAAPAESNPATTV
ncbi:putative opsin-like protein [Diplodia seriata]|uniref:Putative opsin-like protein n=1 Tax=Diplodia seriata TaxID=420778 RepID=A0A0G2EGT2_9PEZI|nr:putative opsin-like protein [Diplodia seriata]